MNAVIESPLEREIARIKRLAERRDEIANEWAEKCGRLEWKLKNTEVTLGLENTALRRWKYRAQNLIEDLNDYLLTGTTDEGDGDGINPAKCRELVDRIGTFLSPEDE